jgi:hypothetical protein
MERAHPNHDLISSEQVEGTSVFDRKGEKVGKIDHLMIDKKTGHVTYAVMSFGGFMGLGHNHYPLPWSAKAIAPRSANSSCAMRRNSPTMRGRTATGRPASTTIMACPITGRERRCARRAPSARISMPASRK